VPPALKAGLAAGRMPIHRSYFSATQPAMRMAVNEYRTLYLIDKSGKLSWGFSLDPPTEEQVDELLK
jgi:hypothetical protein